MRALFLILFLSGCTSGSLSVPPKPVSSGAISPRSISSPAAAPFSLEESLEKIRLDSGVPALAVMKISHGSVAQSAVVGVRKWGDPTLAQITDPFHLGSDTKAMTATLFAMLVEEKKVKWDSTLESLFPEIRNMHPDFKKVTVEMLLAHRSGLQPNYDRELTPRIFDSSFPVKKGRQLTAQVYLSRPAAVSPGSQMLYSNLNYILVGRIIEKLTGQSWEEVIKKRLFRPLKMKSCGFGPAGNPRAKIPDAPWPHAIEASGPVPLKPDWNADNPPTLGPAGTVHCSLEDWSKFLQLHLDGANHKPTAVLTFASFAKLHESYPGQQYTYGGWLRVAKSRTWGDAVVFTHDGSNTLNYATAVFVPITDAAYMAVSNIGGDPGEKAASAARSKLDQTSAPSP